MLNWLPRTISARHMHTIVLVLIAGSLMSFTLGQQMAHGARTDAHAVGERISSWVMAAPSRPVAARPSAHPSTAMVTVSRPPAHHDKHHGGDHKGGGNGGDGGGGD